jgi:hypothetical protein
VVVAGCWPSRSLPGLARRRAGLRGVPTAPRRDRPSLAEEPATCGPSGLRSPSELSLLPLVEPRPPLVGFVRRCGPDRGFRRDPEPGAVRPSTDSVPRKRDPVVPRASTPARIAARFGPEEPSSESCSVRVVSHHLDGFLRSEVAGLLHPAAGHGVRCVSGSRIPGPRPGKPDRGGRTDTVLAAHFTPPEGILDCSRTTSPWPLPPCRWRCPPSTRRSAPLPVHPRELRETTTSTSGRCSAAEFGPPPTVAGRGTPCPSMGFVPLRGPSREARAFERAPRVVTMANHPKKNRQSDTRLRSAPRQRPCAAGPARHPCGRRTRGRPIRRSEDRSVAAWARHAAVPKNDAAPGDAAPPVRMVDASPRVPFLVRDERGRILEAVGIPSAVHRGTVGSRSSRV